MAAENEHPEKIRVFPLTDPQVWVEHQDAIKKTIMAAINPGLPGFLKVKYTFSVDPVCGWIRYNLGNDLWHSNPKRSLPKDSLEAINAAKEFISRLQENCLKKEYLDLQIPSILPVENFAKIQLVIATPVFHFNKPWIDHWLCRFEIKLKPFEKNLFVQTYGCTVDVRIGQKSKVVGFVSQWRPAWLDREKLVEYVSVVDDKGEHEKDKRSEPVLIYELDGENCPQNFLTPFHLVLEGHHGGMLPASNHSIVSSLDFVEKEQGGAVAFPVINGGSGEYEFNWSFWQPDNAFETGLVSLGVNSKVELSPGTYNILLHIKDTNTSVIKLCERMAFVKASRTNSLFS